MSDLISRQALERKCKGSYLTPDDFRFEIRNAPAIEQGEAVAWSQFDDEGEEVMTWHRFDCIPTSIRESVIPLYLAPQQPHSVADALEEAAKICDRYHWIPYANPLRS